MYLKNGREALGINSNTEEGRQKLEKLREGIVAELIDRALISQEARRRGLQISPEQMREAESRTIAQLGGDAKYDAYLAENHFTREEYRDVISTEVYGELMRAELAKGLGDITNDEINTYYEAHKNDPDLQMPETVTASHILITARAGEITERLRSEQHLSDAALTAAVNAELAKRKARAEALRQKALGGDFTKLAREYSEDPPTRERGGDLGTFARGSHSRAFDEAAFALKPGAISPVVQTEFGFHVIKVTAHDPARAQSLAEAMPSIKQKLMGQREAAKLNAALDELRQKAAIKVGEAYRLGELKRYPAL
jgi:parvulin-like peptidyl-prolyl isomerase